MRMNSSLARCGKCCSWSHGIIVIFNHLTEQDFLMMLRLIWSSVHLVALALPLSSWLVQGPDVKGLRDGKDNVKDLQLKRYVICRFFGCYLARSQLLRLWIWFHDNIYFYANSEYPLIPQHDVKCSSLYVHDFFWLAQHLSIGQLPESLTSM